MYMSTNFQVADDFTRFQNSKAQITVYRAKKSLL